MKLIITGASGFIGRQLVPRLHGQCDDILLVGRDPNTLSRNYPGCQTASFDDFAHVAKGYDTVLHLSVLNTTADAPEAEFINVNAELTRQVAEQARGAGVPVFVNFCSFHALENGPDTPYARSKRAGVKALETVNGIKIINLFLPAVHGDQYAGKLALLRRVPKMLRTPIFTCLSALMPTVHVDRVADFILQDLDKAPADDPVFLADPKETNVLYRLGHLLVDYGFALSVILLFWWLLLIVWLLVKTGSEGPGLFAQTRVGKDGKAFVCYKFRSMQQNTRQAGTHEVSESAVTTIGAFIRKTKIDELPQVWNILRGDLSLVGPRPCLPVQAKLVAERKRRGVLEVRPGITGLAQIQGIDMSDPVKLAKKDAEYIVRRGLLPDLKIILATFTGKGQGDRVSK